MRAPTLIVPLLVTVGCGPSPDEPGVAGCDGGKCDDADGPTAAACDGFMVDKSGRGLGDSFAGSLGDPIAVRAFTRGESCPTTASEVRRKLEDDGCFLGTTTPVSEVAALTRSPAAYRTVTEFICEHQGTRVFFSMFGVRHGQPLPPNAEMLAMDPQRGVFNYYEIKGGRIQFFGSSDEFVIQGPGEGDTRRCAGCHTGGGLVMKELRAPWQHWESPDLEPLPGSASLIEENADDFGSLGDAEIVEHLVVEQNRTWNDHRLSHLLDALDRPPSAENHATVADVIRPLFCTTEVMLDSGFGVARSIPFSEVIYPEEFSFSGGTQFPETDYDAITRVLFNQTMAINGLVDTQGKTNVVVRAAADKDFVQLLTHERRDIVSREFVEDVMLVDMTRPLFSAERCELLKFAPDLGSSEVNAKAIRNGFIDKLEAADPKRKTPAADLLRNLLDDTDDPAATAERLAEACNTREAQEDQLEIDMPDQSVTVVTPMARDILLFASHTRALADELPVFEFPGLSMPLDAPPVPQELAATDLQGLRFHPKTCRLTNTYPSFKPVRE